MSKKTRQSAKNKRKERNKHEDCDTRRKNQGEESGVQIRNAKENEMGRKKEGKIENTNWGA